MSYPLEIAKSERPDFLVDARRGIEVAEATEEDWQRELTESEAGEDNTPAEAELIGGDGFVGERPECDWCAAIIRAINNKVDSLNDPDYPVESCDLLLYVNSRMSVIVHEERAIEILGEVILSELERWRACARLRRVIVLTNSHVLPDLLSAGTVLSVAEQ